jgi:hypothetical protein
MIKSTMTNKCTSSAGRFDGHGGAPEQYRWHRLMWHVQGYSQSHWIPPRATTCYVLPQRPPGQQANKQQSTNTPKMVAALMAMAMHWYVTTRIPQWRRSRASLEATGRRHLASIMSNNINWTWLRRFFMFSLSKL